MKIQYGATMDMGRAAGIFFLGFVTFGVSYYNSYLHCLFGQAETSILLSRGLNVPRIAEALICDLPYDDCRCLVVSNATEKSEKCITYGQLVVSRILPLVSFFLQIILTRELFSFSGNYRRVLVYSLWIASIFIFICITIGIYYSSCYHVYITGTLFATGEVFCFIGVHNLIRNDDHQKSISDQRTQMRISRKSEKTKNTSSGAINSKSLDVV
jgi:hypothetical protein